MEHPPPPSPTHLILRLRAGRRSALAGLYDRFSALPGRVAGTRADPDEIANEVFLALWHKSQTDARLWHRVTNTATLVSALARLTRDRLSRRHRDDTRLKRDVQRTEPLGEVTQFTSAIEPHDLPPELTTRQRRIVEYRVLGWDWEDIAPLVCASERTLYRDVDRIRSVFAARGDAPPWWQPPGTAGR